MWFPKRWLTNDKGLARDLNHVIFWNHVVVTCVPFTCIGWPQMTWFLNYRFLVAFRNLIFRIWSTFAKSYFIPGAIFGKNVEQNYKISCSGNGNPPQRWRKTWNWCQFLLIFECHDCSVSFRSFACRVTWGHVNHFWPYFTWLTSDSILEMFNFCVFEKNR